MSFGGSTDCAEVSGVLYFRKDWQAMKDRMVGMQ
jgi:hypothetical protein